LDGGNFGGGAHCPHGVSRTSLNGATPRRPTVRSCVLMKPRPKKKPDRFVWAFSHKGLSKIWGRSVPFGARLAYFFLI
jgi:hypothetical protein